MKRILMFGSLLCAALMFLYSCQKELSQESNLNNASFSFHNDTSFACLSDSILLHGAFYDGVSAERDTNFVTIIINVKKTGNYSIATDSVNGFYFAASGFFSKTGFDTLILAAKGTPILVQLNDFVLSDSTGSCSFAIDVKDSTGTGLGGVDTSGGGSGDTVTNGNSASYVDPNPAGDGKWHFTDSNNNKTYSGDMLPATLLSNFGLNALSGTGTGSSTSEVFNFVLNLPNTTIATGSYPADGVTGLLTLANTTSQAIEYSADGSTDKEAADPSYMNITSYDASAKRLKISFRCWTTDSGGNVVLIKGSINTTVQ